MSKNFFSKCGFFEVKGLVENLVLCELNLNSKAVVGNGTTWGNLNLGQKFKEKNLNPLNFEFCLSFKSGTGYPPFSQNNTFFCFPSSENFLFRSQWYWCFFSFSFSERFLYLSRTFFRFFCFSSSERFWYLSCGSYWSFSLFLFNTY